MIPKLPAQQAEGRPEVELGLPTKPRPQRCGQSPPRPSASGADP